jgi:hypothetical protein
MEMKTARGIAQELTNDIKPPRGTAIVVNEAPFDKTGRPQLDYPSYNYGPSANSTPRREGGRTTQIPSLD